MATSPKDGKQVEADTIRLLDNIQEVGIFNKLNIFKKYIVGFL